MKSVRIGDYLELKRTRFDPEPTKEFHHVGVRSFGKGVIEYGPTLGAELSKVTYHRFPDDALLISNIKAWEGAVTVVGREHKDFIASQRFLPYVPKSSDQIDLRYAFHYLLSDRGIQALGKASPGSADRNRTLGQTAFDNIEIPLPDIAEQRAIAAQLDRTVVETGIALDRIEEMASFRGHIPRWIQREFETQGLGLTSADNLYSVVNSLVRPGDDPSPATRFVGLEHVESHSGRRLGAATVENLTGRKFRFESGDVLFGYLRPYQNKVWVADGDGLCSVEQFVLRPSPGVDAHLLAWALRSQATLDSVVAKTNSLQLPRLRSSQLASTLIFDVRRAEAGLLDRLNTIGDSLVRAHALSGQRRDALRALPQAARNAEFARLMS